MLRQAQPLLDKGAAALAARDFAAAAKALGSAYRNAPLPEVLLQLARLAQATQDRQAHKAVEGIRQSWRALDDLLSQVLDLTRMDSGVVQADLRRIGIRVLEADDAEGMLDAVHLQHFHKGFFGGHLHGDYVSGLRVQMNLACPLDLC